MAKNKKVKKKNQPIQKIDTTASPKVEGSFEKPFKRETDRGEAILPGSWKVNGLIFLSLLIITIILYSPDLHLGFFTVDDPGYVTDNPWIKSVSGKNLAFIFTHPYFANFSPLHIFSYLIDYTIAGPDPFFFHLSSNIWAGIAAGFVFLVALALIRNRMIAIIVSLLFVFHPSHVEAIAWISSRKDIIAAAFALPCFLAYMKYRKGGEKATRWYIITLVLFVFAVAGKLSVATFPAILLAYDLFIEKSSFVRSLPDKIPFLAIGILFALVVASAQPSSGNRPDPFFFLSSLGQSLWLLTGFGSYVLNRMPPANASAGLEIVSVILLAAIFFLPYVFRKRIPMTAMLIYWILFTYLPSQVLSFVHPVTDRYLFMPSVAVVIMIGLGINYLIRNYKRIGLITSLSAAVIIAAVWLLATSGYLNEWRDPRSVWYGALNKSKDPDVYYSLGAHYLNVSGQLEPAPGVTVLSEEKKESLANKVWQDDPRLPKLLAEWKDGKTNGPVQKEFRSYLWQLTEDAFKHAFERQGTRAMPHLYFRLGVLYLNRGDYKSAKEKFLQTIDEITRYTVIDVGHELTVASYSNLGLMASKQGDFKEALQWYKLGEEKQIEFGGNWNPGIGEERKKMEAMVGLQSGNSNTNDPNAAFNLGMYYVNSADKIPTMPVDDAKRLANDVWKNDPQLSALNAEWDGGQHGGVAEKNFQSYLKKLAWDAFENAVRSKGTTINSNLYFRRGMLLGEKGDMNGARNEFQSALNEAAKETNEPVKKEVTVTSLDALGILSWREKNYKDALQWFQKALQQQTSFGGNWVPDLNSKIKQMETMVASGAK